MKSSKMTLESLRVQSFVTAVGEESLTIAGGSSFDTLQEECKGEIGIEPNPYAHTGRRRQGCMNQTDNQ